MAKRARKRWTNEERKYIEESFGKKSFVAMARYLNRTVGGVESEARKMGLTHSKNETGMVTVQALADILGIQPKVIKRWVENLGLPIVQKVTRVKARFTFVNIEKFWNWAHSHQDQFDSRRFERLLLGPEPDWMKEKRKRDFISPPRMAYTEWPKEDTEKLKLLMQKKMSYVEIAQKIGKTYRQVYSKVRRMNQNKNKDVKTG